MTRPPDPVPIDPQTPDAEPAPATRRLAAIAFGAFLLIGWSSLLVPALLRSIKADFGQTDAGLGVFYLVSAVFYALGSYAGGLVTERIGRRGVLTGAALLIGVGLALQATAPTWLVFMAAGAISGGGSGVVDGGMNGLVLALFPRRPGGALNLLHLFFSLGAAGSPLIVGQLVGAGIDWQAVVLGTAVYAIVIGLLFGAHRMPSGRRERPAIASAAAPGDAARPPTIPLIALALAIAFYVSSEIGVSNWLVRFLEDASNDVATATLAAFWGGLAASRLLAARVADRFDPVGFATACSLAASLALIAAIAVPSVPVSIALFVVCGFAFGPVYPMIMTIGGALFPRRVAAVTGALAGTAVVGGIVYPPLMGVISDGAGIAVAMLGTGALALACAVALVAGAVAARRLAGAPPRPEPATD